MSIISSQDKECDYLCSGLRVALVIIAIVAVAGKIKSPLLGKIGVGLAAPLLAFNYAIFNKNLTNGSLLITLMAIALIVLSALNIRGRLSGMTLSRSLLAISLGTFVIQLIAHKR